ncbi:MAG: hypothetical protein NXI32_11025 [bacterium]|nr:hypothetical protein [bacterium]
MPLRPPWLAFFSSLLFFAVPNCMVCGQPARLAMANIRREVAVDAAEAERLLASLASLLGERFVRGTGTPERFEIRTKGEVVVFELRVQERRAIIAGSPRVTLQLAKVATVFVQRADSDPAIVLPLNANARLGLERAGLLRSPPFSQAAIQTGAQFILPHSTGKSATNRLAAAQQQPSDPTQRTDPVNSQPPPEDITGVPLQPFDDVQVEMLPDIDAIILRGRDQQLKGLAEIIRRLDEASQLAQPEIEVILLEHAQAESLAALIESTQESLFSGRQGRASLLPLVKPNALLLIGWGEAVGAAKQLIAKLDMPVAPGTQFDVIQLEHAFASQVQVQLQGFFQNRGGLGPVIQSTVDARINALIVHAAPRDLQEVRRLIERIDVPRGGAMQQARVFEIRNSLAADVAQLLQQALEPSGSSPAAIELRDQAGKPLAASGILEGSRITVNRRNNSLVVSAAKENMDLIELLIEQLDTPGMVAKIKIFPIYNGDAGALVETLQALLPNQAPGTIPALQLSSAVNESSLVPLRFTVDARGNNIIVIGSDGDLRIVEALIVRLDESDSMQRKSTVYQLKNSPAVDVALAINEFLRNKRQVETATPGSANPFEQLEKEVVVVPEPVQNKLILSATPRYYEEIARLIEQLDQQPPQVMIQVMIAEILLGDTDEFGIEVGLQNSVLFDRSLLGDLLTRTNTINSSTPAGVVTATVQEIVAASNVPGFNFNSTEPLGNSGSSQSLASSGQVGGQGISNFAVGRQNDRRGFGGLVLSASSENVSFLLRALQDTRRLEILSRPQVLTLDNQQAFIQVGQRVPRIVNSIINQNGAQNNVELENVGLIIGVTPRISPEGNVVMEIDAEKSQLGPENEGIPVSIAADGTVIRSPRVDTITAQATVSAADGETIILGGLIARRTQTIHRKVPWIGDLPILKHLFRYNLFDSERTELLIIMTPHVVRSQGDMERLKQAEFARMSWCEADIFSLHGDVSPMTHLTTGLIEQGDWRVVYPDIDPRGSMSPSQSQLPSLGTPQSGDGTPGFEVIPTPAVEPRLSPGISSRPGAVLQEENRLPISAESTTRNFWESNDNSLHAFPDGLNNPESAAFSVSAATSLPRLPTPASSQGGHP